MKDGARVDTARQSGAGYYLQQPSLAMSTMTDERLKLAEQSAKGLGFHSSTAGLPHARDAARHGLTFARREAHARARGRSLVVPYGVWPPPAA